ncbi:hypothetical protein U0070_012295, partial [Myodes glareolus]
RQNKLPITKLTSPESARELSFTGTHSWLPKAKTSSSSQVKALRTNAAPVCLAVKRACSTFLLFSEKALKKELGRYDAPPEAVEAKLQVKRCVDSKLSYVERVSVAGV